MLQSHYLNECSVRMQNKPQLNNLPTKSRTANNRHQALGDQSDPREPICSTRLALKRGRRLPEPRNRRFPGSKSSRPERHKSDAPSRYPRAVNFARSPADDLMSARAIAPALLLINRAAGARRIACEPGFLGRTGRAHVGVREIGWAGLGKWFDRWEILKERWVLLVGLGVSEI